MQLYWVHKIKGHLSLTKSIRLLTTRNACWSPFVSYTVTKTKIFPYEHSSPGYWHDNFWLVCTVHVFPLQMHAKFSFISEVTRVNLKSQFCFLNQKCFQCLCFDWFEIIQDYSNSKKLKKKIQKKKINKRKANSQIIVSKKTSKQNCKTQIKIITGFS